MRIGDSLTPHPVHVADLDTDAPVDIVGNGHDPEERRQALAELEKRKTVGRLEGDNDG